MVLAASSPVAQLRDALGAELRETHNISWVLLAGDRAYKFKKPLRLPFLDYGTLERRRALCHEEVRLNRRLAPAVYLGVPELRAVVLRLAAFHAEAAIPADPAATVAGLGAMLRENFATLRTLVRERRPEIDDAAALAAAVLGGRRAELLRRARSGRVRDGHGDLQAEHVVLERGIEIVDCVEFDAALREQDVGLDLAFLAMDLARVDPRLARALVDAYRVAGGDPGEASGRARCSRPASA